MTDEIYRGLSTNRIGDFEIKFSDGLFAVRPIELTKEAVKQINQKLTQAEEPIAKKQKAYEQQRDTVLAEISKSSGLPIK